jgi:cobalamin-dependent methionine synthase I
LLAGTTARLEKDLMHLSGKVATMETRCECGAYHVCPDLDDQTKVAELLEIDRIGVSLTEEFHLVPEQSTSAIIVPHPEAKYFVV